MITEHRASHGGDKYQIRIFTGCPKTVSQRFFQAVGLCFLLQEHFLRLPEKRNLPVGIMGLGRQEAQHLFSVFILAGKGTVDAETFFIKIYILPHQAAHFCFCQAKSKKISLPAINEKDTTELSSIVSFQNSN